MKSNLRAFFLFSIISGILIFSWFRYGHLYGGGDVGLQTYNPQRILENAKYVWWDSTAPGSPIPQGLSAIPFQFSLFLLQSLGFSPLLLQATFFFAILTLMGFGMYLFLAEKLENQPKFYHVIGGLFYMLNPYMMVQVWHRFIHTTIVLAAALPFLALFWDKWIRKGTFKSLAFFLLTNFLAVYIFGTFAFIVTVWIFLLLLTLSNLVPWSGKRGLFKVIGRFSFGLIVWILINSWHLYPVTRISPAILSAQHKSSESIVTLVNISTQAMLPYTLQLANPYYLFDQAELGPIYKNTFFQILPWFFVVTILIGLINSFKVKSIALYGILFIFSIFLVKGVSPPLGNLYILGFKNIFALGVLRNPFEKTGLIMVFFATILFVWGLKAIYENLITRFNPGIAKITIFVILISIFIFSWPMIAGKIIGRYDKLAFVDVPESYKLADQWLNAKKTSGFTDGKILHLPLTRGESVQYRWEFGYNGLEPSDTFFTAFPSISRGFNIQRTDDSLTALSLIFYKPYNDDGDKILRLLRAFNVRFIVLHKDINWLGGDLYNPHEAEKVLDSLEFIERKAEYGDLVIYEIPKEFFAPKIEIKDNIALVYPQEDRMRVWPWITSQSGNFVSPIQNDTLNDWTRQTVTETLIFPQQSFSYPQVSDANLESIIKELSVKLSVIQGTVQYLKQLGTIQTKTEQIVQEINLSSSKLIELFTGRGMEEYSALMDHILPNLTDESNLYFDIAKTNVLDIFKMHEAILSHLSSKDGQVLATREKIRELLKKEKMLPLFPFSGESGEVEERQFNNFWVDSEGKYELILADAKAKEAYLDKLEKVDSQINGENQTLTGKANGNIISLGIVDLGQGTNEISFATPPAVNLFPSKEAVQLEVFKNNPAAVEIPIFAASGEDIYQISWEGRIPAGIGLYIQIIQDTDSEENGQKIPRVSFLQHFERTDWQGKTNLKLPALALQTRQAKIRLVGLIPTEVSTPTTSATVLLNNLRVVRVLNNQLFLQKAPLDVIKKGINAGQINFTKINATEYRGEIKLTKPQFVFFKETYHPGWKLSLATGNKIIEPKLHYLGYLYSNVWFVDAPGEYKFKITFEPQNSLYIGFLLTGVGLLSLFIYGFLKLRLR